MRKIIRHHEYQKFSSLECCKTITVTTTPTFGGGRCRGGVKKRGEKEVDEDQKQKDDDEFSLFLHLRKSFSLLLRCEL